MSNITVIPDAILCSIIGYLLYDPHTLAYLSETCRSIQRSCQIPALLSRLLYTGGASIPAPDQIQHLTQIITKIVHITNRCRDPSHDIATLKPCSWITPELALGLYDRIVHSEALPGRVQVDLLQQLLDHVLPGPVFPAIFSIPDLNVFNLDLANFISNYPLPERIPFDLPPVIIRAVQRFVSRRASMTTSSSIAFSKDITNLNCIERIRYRYPPPFNQVYPWNFQLADYLLSQRSVRPYLIQPRVVLALLRYGIRFDIMSIGRLVNFHLDTISRILPFTYSAKRPALTSSQTIGFRLFSNFNTQEVEFIKLFHVFKQLCRDQFLFKSIFLNHIAYILQRAPSDQYLDVLHDPFIRFLIRTYPHLFLLKLPFLDHYLPTQQVNVIFHSNILSMLQDDPELLFIHIRCLVRSGNITAVARLLSLNCIDEYISSCKDRLTDLDHASICCRFFSSLKQRRKHIDRSSASYWFFHELLPDPLFSRMLNLVAEGRLSFRRSRACDYTMLEYLIELHGPAHRHDTDYYRLPQQVLHYVFTNHRSKRLHWILWSPYFWMRALFFFPKFISYVQRHGSPEMWKKLANLSSFGRIYQTHRHLFKRKCTSNKIIKQYIPRFYRFSDPVYPTVFNFDNPVMHLAPTLYFRG